MTTQQIITAQHSDIDDSLDELEDETQKSSHKSEVALLAWLLAALAIRKGVIDRSPANVRTARAIPGRFNSLLSRNGFDAGVGKFMVTMNDQHEVFDMLVGASLHTKPPHFTAEDLAYLAELKQQTALAMVSEGDAVARRLAAQITNLMGQPASDLGDIVKGFAEGLPARTRTVAEIGVTTYFRTIADIGYEKVEKEHPGLKLKYTYAGPHDERNREFCDRLMTQVEDGRTWTREEIDAMDNGQTANVFTTCGGFGCRHMWLGVVAL